jgi:glycosyltransferase involved in cell wall biosynthesis
MYRAIRPIQDTRIILSLVQHLRFSLILETENLAEADPQGLWQSLASLEQQSLSPQLANEVLIIDSSEQLPQFLNSLCDRYPWLKIHAAPLGTNYYQAKMLGARLATGDIVVYGDCDCTYNSDWLFNLLQPFILRDDVEVVAGETTTRSQGIYGTAMALAYIFPPYSGEQALSPSPQYFLNNVAFRRDLLLHYPIPDELPLYRGHCVIHAHLLLQQGKTIWRQPQARSVHSPPNGLNHFIWRFLLIGYDYYWLQQLLNANPLCALPTRSANPELRLRLVLNHQGTLGKLLPPSSGFTTKVLIFTQRCRKMVQAQPLHLLYLPLALPIVLVAALLILIGYWVTASAPNYLLSIYRPSGHSPVVHYE